MIGNNFFENKLVTDREEPWLEIKVNIINNYYFMLLLEHTLGNICILEFKLTIKNIIHIFIYE